MTEAVSRYLPGSWAAVVRPGVWLLVDARLDASVAGWLWPAFDQAEADVDGLLGELFRAIGGMPGGFVFAQRTAGDGTRVIVRGPAAAEITDAEGGVHVVRHEGGGMGTELSLPGAPINVRIAVGLDEARAASAEFLPLVGGVVMASVIECWFATAVEPAGGDAAGPISQPDGEDVYLDDFMEPVYPEVGELAQTAQTGARDPLEATTMARVVEAADLDWMRHSPEPTVSETRTEVEAQVEAAVEAEVEVDAEAEAEADVMVQEPVVPVPPVAYVPPAPPTAPVPALAPAQPMFGASDQPLVTAVRCPSGHLNPAGSTQCRVCSMGIPSQQPVTVARPILGRLRLSNGEFYALDRDAVFGRKPEIPVGRPGPRPNAIALTDDRDVSRNHVEIRLDGWRVLALDLGSMNGTRLAAPNLAPQLLPPMAPQEIGPGSVLTLAPDVWIYFEDER